MPLLTSYEKIGENKNLASQKVKRIKELKNLANWNRVVLLDSSGGAESAALAFFSPS